MPCIICDSFGCCPAASTLETQGADMLTADAKSFDDLPADWKGKGWRPKDCTPKEAFRFAQLFGEHDDVPGGDTWRLEAGGYRIVAVFNGGKEAAVIVQSLD